MSYKPNKTAGPEETVFPKDCFAEKTKSLFWITVIIIVGAVVYAIVTSSGQKTVYSYPSTSGSFSQAAQLQNVALIRCPYCPGFLDSQGRCNIRECPIYSPNWGQPPSTEGIPVKKILIKELALEAAALQGRGTVIMQSVYTGGNADKAGLKAGDRIVRFNGRKVKSVKQFEAIVSRAKPESNVKIQIIRGERKIKSSVMIGKGEMEGVILPKTGV
jgi:membrane-associated protease RseP (regulator of RpoE activity)